MVEIGQSWKFDLYVDLWPRRKGRASGSPWQLLIRQSWKSPRRTFWHLNLTPLSKSDKVENLTFLLTFDPKERVGRRGHHDNFWSCGRDEQFDTSIVEIGQSWKFDLSVDLWPRRKGRMSGSPWQLLIVSPRRTIWHLNRWNRTKLKIWPLCWPLTPKKGSDVGVTMTTFDPLFKTNILTPQSSKSDKVENLTFLLTFDPEERVGCRGHHDNFWSSLQDEHFDTLIVEIGQSWKFDLCIWPRDPIWPRTFLKSDNFCSHLSNDACTQVSSKSD